MKKSDYRNQSSTDTDEIVGSKAVKGFLAKRAPRDDGQINISYRHRSPKGPPELSWQRHDGYQSGRNRPDF